MTYLRLVASMQQDMSITPSKREVVDGDVAAPDASVVRHDLDAAILQCWYV